jgi:hypothetical protein
VHFRAHDFVWVQGQPTRFRSSEFAQRGFCANCGSTLTMHEEVLSSRVQVAVGSLDEPERARIDDHVWTEQQLSWFRIADDLPRFPRSSAAVPTKALGDETQTPSPSREMKT